MIKNKKIIGITGLIGSGKTTAGKYFSRRGALFINSDKVVRELYKNNRPGTAKIASFFGKQFLKTDGSVNRRKLAGFVFCDVKKLEMLNRLVHPLILEEIKRIIIKSKEKLVFVEAVYFRKGALADITDGIIYISCHKNKILCRNKDGSNKQNLIKEILKNQEITDDADWVIYNNRDKSFFYNKLDKVYQKIIQLKD